MSTKPNRLVVFDCDGTLVDSQHHITDCMAAAFGEQGLTPPTAEAVRAVVGLALAEAIGRLVPAGAAADLIRLTESYKRAFFALRQRPGMIEPLYDGVAAAIVQLAEAGFLLGVATGKSRRGLDAVLAAHGLSRHFVTLQTADSAPGKPDPTMLRQAIAEAGAAPETAVMIGDTTLTSRWRCVQGSRRSVSPGAITRRRRCARRGRRRWSIAAAISGRPWRV